MADYEIKGRKYVVTGAANGIGSAVCVELVQQGAYPIGIDIQQFRDSELDVNLRSNNSLGRYLDFHQVDAADEILMQQALRSYLTFDGLVNSAGFLGTDRKHGGVDSVSLANMLHSHVFSAMVATEIVSQRMQEGGSIVNIGSIEADMPEEDVVLYATAKGALKSMTFAYANKLAPNIRVNMISPGNVNTQRNMAQYQDPESMERISRFEGRTPLRKSAHPWDIAQQTVFYLSHLSRFTTGANIVVDGGYTRALLDPSWKIPK